MSSTRTCPEAPISKSKVCVSAIKEIFTTLLFEIQRRIPFFGFAVNTSPLVKYVSTELLLSILSRNKQGSLKLTLIVKG